MSLIHLQVLPLVLAAWALAVAQARHKEAEENSAGAFEDFEMAKMAKVAEDFLTWRALPVLASPLIAVLGFFVKSIAEARAHQRQMQLERVQLQIQEFYGPISALSHRGKAAFNSMLDVYARRVKDRITADDDSVDTKVRFLRELASMQDRPGDDPRNNPAVKLWVHFVTEIAYPVNSRIVQLLTDKSHLHDGPLPNDYLDLFGLVAERELVIAQWKEGYYGQLLFEWLYPSEFDSMIEERLQALQEMQVLLGGAKTPKHSKNPRAGNPKLGRRLTERYTLTQTDDPGAVSEAQTPDDGGAMGPVETLRY